LSIKNIRKSKHISARKVYMKLNIDKSTFKNMEECKSSMRVEWLPIMANMYGITKEELLEEYLNERWLKNDRSRKKITRKER
jgi:transcriptional regulator with XRE-family HTH domain